MLRAKDRLQGYDLRDIFYRSAQIAMSSAEKNSSMVHDPNLASGGFEVPTGGRIAQTVEIQLLARLFLGQFQQWLDTLQFEVDRRHEKFRLGRRIGPMFLDPPIDDASLARRDSSQLAILALVGRLRKALMIAINCSGQSMPVYDSLSGKMPSGQIATWSVVHQLVWAAFPNAPDLPALKERWSSATKGREIRFSAWPQAVSRQATP